MKKIVFRRIIFFFQEKKNEQRSLQKVKIVSDTRMNYDGKKLKMTHKTWRQSHQRRKFSTSSSCAIHYFENVLLRTGTLTSSTRVEPLNFSTKQTRTFQQNKFKFPHQINLNFEIR